MKFPDSVEGLTEAEFPAKKKLSKQKDAKAVNNWSIVLEMR